MSGYKLNLLKEYKVQKKWKNWNKAHGVYELTFFLAHLKEFYDGTYTLYDNSGNNPIELDRSISNLLTAIDKGNVSFSNGYVTMIGEFQKYGSQVFFVPINKELSKVYEN